MTSGSRANHLRLLSKIDGDENQSAIVAFGPRNFPGSVYNEYNVNVSSPKTGQLLLQSTTESEFYVTEFDYDLAFEIGDLGPTLVSFYGADCEASGESLYQSGADFLNDRTFCDLINATSSNRRSEKREKRAVFLTLGKFVLQKIANKIIDQQLNAAMTKIGLKGPEPLAAIRTAIQEVQSGIREIQSQLADVKTRINRLSEEIARLGNSLLLNSMLERISKITLELTLVLQSDFVNLLESREFLIGQSLLNVTALDLENARANVGRREERFETGFRGVEGHFRELEEFFSGGLRRSVMDLYGDSKMLNQRCLKQEDSDDIMLFYNTSIQANQELWTFLKLVSIDLKLLECYKKDQQKEEALENLDSAITRQTSQLPARIPSDEVILIGSKDFVTPKKMFAGVSGVAGYPPSASETSFFFLNSYMQTLQSGSGFFFPEKYTFTPPDQLKTIDQYTRENPGRQIATEEDLSNILECGQFSLGRFWPGDDVSKSTIYTSSQSLLNNEVFERGGADFSVRYNGGNGLRLPKLSVFDVESGAWTVVPGQASSCNLDCSFGWFREFLNLGCDRICNPENFQGFSCGVGLPFTDRAKCNQLRNNDFFYGNGCNDRLKDFLQCLTNSLSWSETHRAVSYGFVNLESYLHVGRPVNSSLPLVLPGGSWSSTCSLVSFLGQNLCAQCQGDIVSAPLQSCSNQCDTYSNLNGGLFCDKYPSGSWRTSCVAETFDGLKLTAHCRNTSGGTTRSSIILSRCQNGISNSNGNLRC